MAQTVTISKKELERQAGLSFEGETLKVMLCTVGATGYTSESTVAQWQSVEQSGSGYSRYSTLILPGSYVIANNAYSLPDIEAVFSASSVYSYDRVVSYIDGATYIHSIVEESPNITLAAGQTQTYRVSIRISP